MSREINLYENKLRFNIEDEFVDMEPDECRQYFSGQTPEKIFSIPEKKAFITVMRSGNRLEPPETEKRLNEYYYAYSRSAASFSNGKMVKRELNNGDAMGVFHFGSTTVERNLLNFFALLSVDGQEVIMTLHCAAEDSMRLGKEFVKTLDSVQVDYEGSGNGYFFYK